VRVLILDHYYPQFVRATYEDEPSLVAASYADQRARFDAALFGETGFEVAALRNLGHEAWDVTVNIRPLQAAWAVQHGLSLASDSRWGWQLRRGFAPWPRRPDHRWIGQAILDQIRSYRPDVVHVQCMDRLDSRLIKEMRELVRLVTGQIAAPLPIDRALAGYDLVVSSLPNFVARFRAAGIDSEWLPLAFEPSMVDTIGGQTRNIPVSFVGSLSKDHGGRIELLEAVGARTDVAVWTDGRGAIGPNSPLRPDLHGAAWGAEMYRVLASSRLTLNHHIDVAEGFANNLRLYEGTGMGALLLTDEGWNLGELFVVGREVVTYSSAEDCTEKIRYFSDHEDEARAIATAGQARTLRDHTWRDRMERLIRMIEARL